MVDGRVIESIKKYLLKLSEEGIPVSFGILFGSYALERAHEWSDIDLVVVSPIYDIPYSHEEIGRLWRIAARVDSRIEPIPCGTKEWASGGERVIIEVAKQGGVRVAA